MTFAKDDKELLNKVVVSGVWGTVGPEFGKGCRYAAEYSGNRYSLLTLSYSSALEALLRALETGYGDEVIMPSYCSPVDPMTVAETGATPVFTDIDYESGTVSVEGISSAITDKTRAVIVDQIAGNTCDMEKVRSICKEKGIYLIENATDGFKTMYKGIPASKYADASVVDSGTQLDLGMGGAILTDNEEIFKLAYAYHNCGRRFDEQDNLKVDFILGGNMRIAEWQAALIKNRLSMLDQKNEELKANAEKTLKALECDYLVPLKKSEYVSSCTDKIVFIYNEAGNGYASKETVIKDITAKGFTVTDGFKAMHRQPFFASDYFRKITGRTAGYGDMDLENSVKAGQNYIWVSVKNM